MLTPSRAFTLSRTLKVVLLLACMFLIILACNNPTVTPANAAGKPPTATPTAVPNWTLVWSDEFNGAANTAPSSQNWSYEMGYVRNNEQQYYTNRLENARLDGAGNLLIEARRENFNGFQYTSASLYSQDKREFQYGKFEMRGRIPTPSGSWPAWWALGSNIDVVGWPKSGEIDMMEFYRGMNLFNVMYQNSSGSIIWDSITENVSPTFQDSFHSWVMEWDPTTIKLYMDGVLKNTFNVETATVGSYNPFRQPWYMLANLAIGGNNGGDPSGTTFPLQYYIDYIRVYCNGVLCTAPTATPWPTSPPPPTPVPGNLVSNPGFESGFLSPWGQWNEVEIVGANQHSGNYALHVWSAPASSEQVISGLQSNRTYILKAWAKLAAPGGQEEVMIGVKNHGGPETRQSITVNSYTQAVVTFTTGSTNTTANIYCYKSGGRGDAYCDDFELALAP